MGHAGQPLWREARPRDTIKVRERGESKRRHTVRLIGIDTPETKRPGVRVECGGPEASESIVGLAPMRAKVLLITDPSQQARDRYGRLLAYVQRKGRDVGRGQISRGWATTYVYASKPFSRVDAYRRAEDRAARADRGVHELCGGDFHL
jgi:micrococcal nuclease